MRLTLRALMDRIARLAGPSGVLRLADPGLEPLEGRQLLSVGAQVVAPPVVTISASGTPAEQGPKPAKFTISRSGPTTSELTVNFSLDGTADSEDDYSLVANGNP